MTSLVARSPLHSLSMNGAQANNSRRRSARNAFEGDDEAPPTAKRVKGDVAPGKSASQTGATGAKQVNGRSVGAGRTKAKNCES